MKNDYVMVRAYQDEPVRLSALKVAPTYVLVAGRDRDKAIGFPRDCVFAFDGALFERLRKAFQEESGETLTALWSEAKLLE
jgi:hypothetical protein